MYIQRFTFITFKFNSYDTNKIITTMTMMVMTKIIQKRIDDCKQVRFEYRIHFNLDYMDKEIKILYSL